MDDDTRPKNTGTVAEDARPDEKRDDADRIMSLVATPEPVESSDGEAIVRRLVEALREADRIRPNVLRTAWGVEQLPFNLALSKARDILRRQRIAEFVNERGGWLVRATAKQALGKARRNNRKHKLGFERTPHMCAVGLVSAPDDETARSLRALEEKSGMVAARIEQVRHMKIVLPTGSNIGPTVPKRQGKE